ncbi:hypothetical protein ACFQX7_00025 [Luedemannella flava]
MGAEYDIRRLDLDRIRAARDVIDPLFLDSPCYPATPWAARSAAR